MIFLLIFPKKATADLEKARIKYTKNFINQFDAKLKSEDESNELELCDY